MKKLTGQVFAGLVGAAIVIAASVFALDLTNPQVIGGTFTSPSLVTPNIGAATATTINGNTWTAGTGTLTIAAGKTLTASNTLTFAGTDGQTMTFPTTSATIARTDAANTFTGVQTMTSPVLTTPSIGNATFTGLTATNLVASSTAPTISSGFGNTPSVSANNGTLAFRINVGTGGTATSGVIGLPTAATGWNCTCNDITTNSSTVFACRQSASTTASATVGELTTNAVAAAWSSADILAVSCTAF